MQCKTGVIIPSLKCIFKIFDHISPLTLLTRLVRLLRKRKRWKPSYLVVEIYVVTWLCLLLLSIWLIATNEPFSLAALVVISAVLIWRMLDISQAWFNIFLRREPKVLSPPRSLVLATINYFELSIIFGLLSFLHRIDNFYPTFANITQSLRHSIGVISTTGSNFDPASVGGGFLYYSEIAFGLAFLVVVISRVLSLYRSE
jgi:hypothetical protein